MTDSATTLRPIETLTKADGYVLLWKQGESGEWVADFGTLGTVTACLVGITHWTPVPRVRLPDEDDFPVPASAGPQRVGRQTELGQGE